MASEEIGTLVARIVADNEQFRSEMLKMTRQVESNTSRMNRALASINKSTGGLSNMMSLATKAAGAFGIALSVRGLVRFAQDAIAAGDAIHDVSKAAGIGAESLQELRFAFSQLSQVTDGVTDAALIRFNKTVGEAIDGQSAAKNAMKALNVEFQNQSGVARGTEAVLNDALRSLAGIESDAVRAARAADLFGREAGPQLAAALSQGIGAMDELRSKTPGVISDTNVQLASELNDEFAAMARTVGGSLKNAFIETTARAADFFGVADLSKTSELLLQIREIEEAMARDRTGGVGINARTGQAQVMRGRLEQERELAELRRQLNIERAQAAGTGGFATWPSGMPSQMEAFNEEYDYFLSRVREANFLHMEQQEAQAKSNEEWAVTLQNLVAEFEAYEEMAERERELTEQIKQQHRERIVSAADAAAQEKALVYQSQLEQMDFRTSMAMAVADLANAVFGEQKAVALAAIVFEKLMAVRRIKIAVEQASWLAFASQLVPGDPSSLARAQAARTAVRAAGIVSVAQTVALSVVSGLAEAARVVGSSGAPGSFTNPLSVAAGSSTAGGSAASSRVEHSADTVQVIFRGPVYGWDRYIQHQVIDGIRTAIRDKDVVIIDPTSRQGQMLGAPA